LAQGESAFGKCARKNKGNFHGFYLGFSKKGKEDPVTCQESRVTVGGKKVLRFF
jgi:hypothetical protein